MQTYRWHPRQNGYFGYIMAKCGKICSGRTKDTMAIFGHIDIMATCKAWVKLEFWVKMT